MLDQQRVQVPSIMDDNTKSSLLRFTPAIQIKLIELVKHQNLNGPITYTKGISSVSVPSVSLLADMTKSTIASSVPATSVSTS